MFGRPVIHAGDVYEGPATEVPNVLLQNVRQFPIPLTISGANNVTFTLKGSTDPIAVWVENDIIYLDEDLAYTWNNTSNNILDSDGAAATDVDSVLGIWYMYIGIVVTAGVGVITILPSQTGPAHTPGAGGDGGWLTHPGTTRTTVWRYVGWMRCTTAATPAFQKAEKVGYWYKITENSVVVITDAWTGLTVLALSIPKLGKYGLEVRGALETGSDGVITVGSATVSTLWDAEASANTGTDPIGDNIIHAPFTMAPNDTASPIYGISSAGLPGDIHITSIKDVV